MKRIILSLVIGVFILAFDVLGQEAPAPVYQNGESWTFRVVEKLLTQSTRGLDGDYEVIHKGGKFIVRLAEGEKPETQQDLVILRRLMFLPEDNLQFLQFPLSVGKKWSTSHEVNIRAVQAPIRRNVETSVTGTQEVSTAAGTFRAFKIERLDTGNIPAPRKAAGLQSRWNYIYYYSPQTRSIVKFSFENETGDKRDIELIKYGAVR